MADQKKLVAEVTSMDEDFTQWYTDVCIKADLIAYSQIKGFMVIKPYGYAIWENMQAAFWTNASRLQASRTSICRC